MTNDHLQRLLAAGLIDALPSVEGTPHWSVRLLFGFGSLIGVPFLMFVFLYAGFVPSRLVWLGLFLLASAGTALACARRLGRGGGILTEALALPWALIGVFLLYQGVFDVVEERAFHPALCWGLLSLLSLGVAAWFQAWFLSLLMGAAAACFLSLFLGALWLVDWVEPAVLLGLLLTWGAASRDLRRFRFYETLAFGMALWWGCLVFLRITDTYFEFFPGDSAGAGQYTWWGSLLFLECLLTGLILLFRVPWLPMLPLLAASFFIPGFGGGCLMLLLGFYAGRKEMAALGGLALLTAGLDFYFVMERDVGAFRLLGGGLLLLATRFLVRRLEPKGAAS